MAGQRHLSKAPITEAVVDIRTALPKGVDVTILNKLQPKFAERFSKVEAIKNISAKIEFDGKSQLLKSETIDSGIVGTKFTSGDSTKVLQFRNDGFTFSKLKPYEDWLRLRNEAGELWQEYVNSAKPESVSRVALRFINHLNIPVSNEKLDFDDYFISVAKVPPELPQGIFSFFHRVVVPEPSIGAVAVIHQALEAVVDPRIVPVIFDIDVYIQREFEPNSDKIWEALEQLHTFKNNIFFSYITEKTVEIFA